MEGEFQTEYTKRMQTFHHPSLQTSWLYWIHVRHESMLGEGQTEQGTACDSNRCEVTEPAWKTHARGHKLHTDNFFSAPELFDDLAKNQTQLPLRYCQAKQKRHATRPSTEDNKSEKGRHLRNNHGWLDGNTVAGLERHMHADEYSQCPSETSLLHCGRKSPKAANCDGL
jgi:hypothetical protein